MSDYEMTSGDYQVEQYDSIYTQCDACKAAIRWDEAFVCECEKRFCDCCGCTKCENEEEKEVDCFSCGKVMKDIDARECAHGRRFCDSPRCHCCECEGEYCQDEVE